MKFIRGFEGELPVIKIILSIDEARALLKQSQQTWLWKRFRELLKGYS